MAVFAHFFSDNAQKPYDSGSFAVNTPCSRHFLACFQRCRDGSEKEHYAELHGWFAASQIAVLHVQGEWKMNRHEDRKQVLRGLFRYGSSGRYLEQWKGRKGGCAGGWNLLFVAPFHNCYDQA